MRKVLALSLLLGTAVFAGACDDDDDNGTGPNPTFATARVVHASPDAPNVDVRVDGTQIISDLAYTEFTGYAQIESGERDIEVYTAGTNTLAFELMPTLTANTPYTIIASDVLASIAPIVLIDDNTAPAAGNVKVRAVHASPSAPNVDVYITAPTDALGTPTLSNVAFGDASAYLEVPAGTYRVRVTPTGTQTVVIDELYPVVAGQIRTVLAVDGTGLDPYELLVLPDAGPATSVARARVVHGSPDAPNVDVEIDGTVVLADVAYAGFSSYLPVAAGQRTLEVFPTAGGAAVISATPSFTAGSDYTIIASDLLATIAPIVLEDDNSAPAGGNVKVRVVHASPTAGNVDVYITDPGVADLTGLLPDLADVAFGDASAYLEMAAASYRVRVTPTGTQTVEIDGTFDLSTAGLVRTVLAIDGLGLDPFEFLVLPDAP